MSAYFSEKIIRDFTVSHLQEKKWRLCNYKSEEGFWNIYTSVGYMISGFRITHPATCRTRII